MSDSERTVPTNLESDPDVRPVAQQVPAPRAAGVEALPGPPTGSKRSKEALLASAPVAALALPATSQVLAGRYTVLEALGQGGMGVVLAAYDARLDRRVALKLLHGSVQAGGSGWEDSASMETRLVREAQAMARLNHPNVVQVYDAGPLEDGRIFLAMEYVQGKTLRLWCSELERPWREVLAAYVEAGRGLAAAHSAGLVHRDFKPDNVLVGSDGRVRVTDFGLARAGGLAESETTSSASLPPHSQAWELPLTMTGTVVGTPKYMAPELLNGEPADARSDLFAFCVALYEALYRQPAFPGTHTSERLRAQRMGHINPPPAQSPVPAWVMRAVLRGLLADRERRPVSMRELLDELENDPEVKRRARLRTLALSSAVAALAGLAAMGWVRQQQLPACARMERRLSGIWDETVQAQARAAFVATGLPYAEDTFARVSKLLGDYTGRWVRLRTEACEALQAQAGQPRSLAVMQEYCLERRLSQVRGLTELLARKPDKELVPRAVEAAQSLPPLDYCADVRALTAAVPPPEDPRVREKADSLQAHVDRLEALHEAAKYKEGLAQAEGLLREVDLLGHAPLRAQALYQVARLRDGAGDYKGAEALARQAIELAAQGKDDALTAKAWGLLVFTVGRRQSRHADAMAQELGLQAAAARADDDQLRSYALSMLGNVLDDMGQYERALAHFQRALDLRQKVLGPDHPGVASLLSNIGGVYLSMGQYPQALAQLERALALREKALGPEHPDVASLLSTLGLLLQDMGLNERARAVLERSLVIREKALGPEHPDVAGSITNLGLVHMGLGHYEQALALFQRALALDEKTVGPEHPYVGDSLSNVGFALDELGHYKQAQEYMERALALRQKALGPEHPDVANSVTNLGIVLRKRGQYAQAQAYMERALALRQKALGPEHPYLGGTLHELALVHLDLGRPEQARALLERALAVFSREAKDEHVGATQSLAVLGRTLVRLGRLDEAEHYLERARASQEEGSGAEQAEQPSVLLGLGELHLSRGQPAQAVPLLERALPLTRALPRCELQWVLAQALWASGQQRERALELASQAREEYRRLGHGARSAEVSRWLAAHRR